MKYIRNLFLASLIALAAICTYPSCSIAEQSNDSLTMTKEDYEKLLKRVKELEDELKRLKKLESELSELRKKIEEAAPPEDNDEVGLVTEEPRKFLNLFGERSDDVPSLDLYGFFSVSFNYSNRMKRGRFTFDGIELEPRFNLFEELQVGIDLEFREPNPDEDDLYVEQAFVSWAPYAEKRFEVTMGRYNSIVGIEAPDQSRNLLATHSYMYNYLLPADQTGLIVALGGGGDWRFFTAVSNSFGYNDKGQRISTDNNYDKTWTVRAEYRPGELTAIGLNLIAGPEKDDDNSDYRYTVDLDFQCACHDVYYIGVEVLYGFEENELGENPSWWGAMGIVNFKFSKALDVSLRLEYLDDLDEGSRLGKLSTGYGPRIWSGALALRFHPLTNMDFVLEYKVDGGTSEYFEPDNTQRTFTVSVTVEF